MKLSSVLLSVIAFIGGRGTVSCNQLYKQDGGVRVDWGKTLNKP
jgi:hypothetical protein